MASVTIPCPSCEAGFAVKESLIGKKVDCPKCKYRFKAELPEDDDDTSKSRKSEKGKKKGGSNTLVIGGVIGALALILLSVAAFFILSGDKPQANANKGGTTTPRPAVSNSNTNTGSETSGSSETKNGTEGQPPTGNGEGSTSGGAGETPKPKPVNTGNLKDVTNLLPGETIAVYKVVMDRVIQTPVFNSIFDKATQEFFRNSLKKIKNVKM